MTTSDSTARPLPDKLLLGLIGAGIQQSLTPAMQEEEARAQGLRVHYQLIDLERSRVGPEALPKLLDAARIMGFAGLNITHPCKQAVIPLLDDLSEDARAIGAVNTVVLRDGRATGHNTDWCGFTVALQRRLPEARLDEVVLLGTGGAGAAIAHGMLRIGARRLRLVDQDPARAQVLADQLGRHYGAGRAAAFATVAQALAGADGLIHATPTGMDAHPGLPLDPALLRPELWVADVVYFPIDTELLKVARSKGCRVADGGGMAVWQAVGAFELFTGLKADSARMEAHFRRMLAERASRKIG
jgi:shikimate dehydrogenase